MISILGGDRPASGVWTHSSISLQVAAAFLSMLALGLEARAQQSFIVAVPPDLPNLVGAALGTAPDYEGSDDQTFGVLPAGQLTFG